VLEKDHAVSTCLSQPMQVCALGIPYPEGFLRDFFVTEKIDGRLNDLN
jgi:hypothetical protein